MELITSINPNRIEWCCAEQGISPAELAHGAGVSVRSVQRGLDGHGMTFNQLSAVANFFGRGVLFFLESDPVNAEQVHTANFRTLANQKPDISNKIRSLIEQTERQREIFLTLREWLDEPGQNLQLPSPSLPENPAHAANVARAWLELGDRNNRAYPVVTDTHYR